jgi:hypothetical protein
MLMSKKSKRLRGDMVLYFVQIHYGIASIYGAGLAQSVWCLATDWTTGVRSPAEAKDCSSSICVQTISEAHPASYPMGTGGPFPGGKARPERDDDHLPHPVPRSIMRSYFSSPPWLLHSVVGQRYFTMQSIYSSMNTVNFSSTSDCESIALKPNNKVIQNRSNMHTTTPWFSIIHASPVSSGERSKIPVCFSFPTVYEYRKYVEIRI